MVNKCSVIGCFTNYAGYDRGTVFPLPKDTDQRSKWITFLNRNDHDSMPYVFICQKHFAPEVLCKTPTRVKLRSELKPVPTIVPDSQKIVNLPAAAIMETIKSARKPPKERIFQEDQLEKFRKKDSIACLNDLASKGPKSCNDGFIFDHLEEVLVMYKLERDGSTNVPQVTYAIHVDVNLRVKLFYKNSPIALPVWFRQGRKTILSSCSMIQPLINHMKQITENQSKHFKVLDSM